MSTLQDHLSCVAEEAIPPEQKPYSFVGCLSCAHVLLRTYEMKALERQRQAISKP